jgi:hypothetical protein
MTSDAARHRATEGQRSWHGVGARGRATPSEAIMTSDAARTALIVAVLVAGCAAHPELAPLDPGLDGLVVDEVRPSTVLPGTTLQLVGRGLPDPSAGSARLRIRGRALTSDGNARDVDVTLPAHPISTTRLEAAIDRAAFTLLGGAGRLEAEATLIVDAARDGALHSATAASLALTLADELAPTVVSLEGGVRRTNDLVVVEGDGEAFLLGDREGETVLVLDGCFLPDGVTPPCDGRNGSRAIPDVELPARPLAPGDRSRVAVRLVPELFGLQPGVFNGRARVENRLAGGTVRAASERTIAITMVRPRISSVTPGAASLGQIVTLAGGGFIGGPGRDDEVTLVRLRGSFRPDAPDGKPATQASTVDLTLVPRVILDPAGPARLEYVLDESDALGRRIDLRAVTGRFLGTVTPIVRQGAREIVGDAATVSLEIAPLRQVVWVRFLPSYLDGLRRFGLAAAEPAIRARILEVARRDFAGVNVDLRVDEPTDFAVYSEVDVAGPDPNGLGLLGYDNTTGKDVGNQRLFDRIGGVNATTQADGFPGYGGIFVDQFLGFSTHPPAEIAELPETDARFDALFDPLRPDRGGRPVTAREAAAIVPRSDGAGCPAPSSAREEVISCAVFALANLIGSTLTHELGHSFGLADPTGELFHNPGDEPNRLMDSGEARPFGERVELDGEGPARFCDEELAYLRALLPGRDLVVPEIARPTCR